MTGTPVLLAEGVYRRFAHPGGAIEVLRGLDLAVDAGEVVTIAGRSGSGKSALMALLGGFDTPDAGTVLLDGAPLGGAPPWQVCAVLPQALGLAAELTVAENVALPLRLRRSADSDREGRAAELLVALGVGHLGDRYPGEVSFGQQQRVALARAVSGRPKVLLADEPTAHLDAGSTPAVLKLLRQSAEDGAAVVIATHDDVVHAAADRCLRLADGLLTGS